MKKLSLLIFLAGFLSFAKATNYADYVNAGGTQSHSSCQRVTRIRPLHVRGV